MQPCFADEIAQGGRAPQSSRAMEDFSHGIEATRWCQMEQVLGPNVVSGICRFLQQMIEASEQLAMPAPSRYLLIDISNSFTKVAIASRARIQSPHRIATERLTIKYLRQICGSRKIDTFVVSSVVPRKNRIVRRAAGKKTKLLWLTPRLKIGVGIDYPEPSTIGADRLANAAAVAALFGCPAIVVDFGTAVTFDIVSADRNYIGGVIAPGLEAMTNFLYQRTALLPKLSLGEPRRAVGRSTIGAMRSGAIFGYRGLVREIISRIKAEEFSGKSVHIVATGGYAKLIASKLSEIKSVRPDLTLEGLRIIGNLNG